jgi:hypothetical protein
MSDKLEISMNALRLISERDPQSDACGPDAPDDCEYGCIGCIARAVLKRLSADKTKLGLSEPNFFTRA